jgi:hypothetical protein
LEPPQSVRIICPVAGFPAAGELLQVLSVLPAARARIAVASQSVVRRREHYQVRVGTAGAKLNPKRPIADEIPCPNRDLSPRSLP